MTKPIWYADGKPSPIQEGTYIIGIGGIYLHGDLEQLAGFDLISIPLDEKPTKDFTVEDHIEPGQYPVTIMMAGVPVDAIASIWDTKYSLKGLIVSPSDQGALDHATERMNQQVNNI